MNRQNKIIISIIVLSIAISLLPEIGLAESESAFLIRSADTLKFEAKQADSVSFSTQNGRFQQVVKDKTAKAEENKAKNADKQPEAQQANTQSDASSSFAISSEFIDAQNAYKLTIADSSGGGLIISDRSLDQAPIEGYQASVEYNLPVQSKAYEAKKYIYLKTKANNKDIPYQYSRLELDMTVGKAKLIMDMTAVTNPDGSGDLKYDKKAQRKYITQRLEEITTAIENKTATESQRRELHELMTARHDLDRNRWDFDGNRRRMMKQKRERLLEADGRLRPQKRDIHARK